MKQNLYHPETGELRRIHHHDVQGWIAGGWLTAPPESQPVATAATPKKKKEPVE